MSWPVYHVVAFYEMSHPIDYHNGSFQDKETYRKHEESVEEKMLAPHRWIYSKIPPYGYQRPRHGLTAGWLPATTETPPGSDPRAMVAVKWEGNHWYDWESGQPYTDEPGNHWLPARCIKYGPTPEERPPLPEVDVSFVVVRWGSLVFRVQYNYDSWGQREGSTVSNRFIRCFFKDHVALKLPQRYEIYTVFVTQSEELDRVPEGYIRSVLRGKSLCGLYFIWAMQGQQNMFDTWTIPGYFDEISVYKMVDRLESVGISTHWAHPLPLWKLLTSKSWNTTLCLSPQYQTPLTVRIPLDLVNTGPEWAAEEAYKTLMDLYQYRKSLPGYVPTNSDAEFTDNLEENWEKARVVCKLGFSYEAMDVKFCKGGQELARALQYLSTKTSYKNDCLLVQQRVNFVNLEFRVYVIEGRQINVHYTRFKEISAGLATGFLHASRREAIDKWFDSDEAAFIDAENQVARILERVNAWMLAECCQPILSSRVDFIVEHARPGKADVWLGEVGEQGYSTQTLDMDILFKALLKRAMSTQIQVN